MTEWTFVRPISFSFQIQLRESNQLFSFSTPSNSTYLNVAPKTTIKQQTNLSFACLTLNKGIKYSFRMSNTKRLGMEEWIDAWT
jgi:hypothetical protein